MKAIVLHSGGIDSSTLLYELLTAGYELGALTIDYGQRHRCELDAARAICKELGIEQRVIDLNSVHALIDNSALTNDSIEVPEGHYTSETMKSTVVPNRNMMMLSLAIAWAVSCKADAVAYAAHGGDHAIYADCRPEFVETMVEAARLCDEHPVQLLTPFLHKTKTEIVQFGAELGVPFKLTWSCYKGGEKHCGKCGTCVERREAFELAGIEDPTVYAIS